MSKHTPGPWTVYDDSNDGKTNRIEIVAIGKTICHIYHSVPVEDLPNANLIAAAPDLLEALMMCRQHMKEERDMIFDCVKNFKTGNVDDHDDAQAIKDFDSRLSYVDSVIAKAEGEHQ